MIRLLTFLLLFLPALALAQNGQGGVQQSGPVTPGHLPTWAMNGVVQDAGPATNGKITNLGLLGLGLPECINDVPAGSIGGWHQLCLGANASGGGLISYQALGGATPLPLQCNVNGVTYNCGASAGPIGGANTQLQFNNSGGLGGDSTLTFNSVTKLLSASSLLLAGATGGGQGAGTINATGIFINGNPVGGSTIGGSNTQIQFNNGGFFGGDATFLFNSTTKAVTASSLTLNNSGTALTLSAGSNASIAGTLGATGGGTLSGTFAGTPTFSGLVTHTSQLASTFSPVVATGGTNCATAQYVYCWNSRPSGTVSGIAFATSETLNESVASTVNFIDKNVQINVGGGATTGGGTTNSTTPAGAPQTGATNGTTASGNATLNFASTPGFVSNNMVIEDITTPTAIPANTLVQSSTGGTVVMTNNAAGAGVGSGDLIVFYAVGSNVLNLASVPAGWSVGNWIADQTGGQLVAGSTIVAKGSTTVTLSHPAVAAVGSSDSLFAFSTYAGGNRVADSVNLTQTIAGMTSSGISSARGGAIDMQGNLGGNALNHVGSGNGVTFGCTIFATALWTNGCSGAEIDLIRLTATAGPQVALVLVENGSSIPSGIGGDTAIFIGAASGATSRFHYGVSFGAPGRQWAQDPYGSLFYSGSSPSGSPSLTGMDTSAGLFHGCEHMSPYHAECALVATGITSATRLTSDGACHNATASCASGFLYMLNVTAIGAGYQAEPALTVTGCSGATAAVGPLGAAGSIAFAMPTNPGSGCKPETTVAVGLAGATSVATIAPVVEGNSLNLPKNSTNHIRCTVSVNDTGPGAISGTIDFDATQGATASTAAIVGSPSWTFFGTDAAITLAAPTADTTLGAINITLTPSAVTANVGGSCTITSTAQVI